MPRGALDRAEVLRVLGNVLSGRIEERQHRDAAVHLRMSIEVVLEGLEPTDDVLRRVRAVDAKHQELGPPRGELGLEETDVVALGELGELGSVDGDRAGHGLRPAAVERADIRLEVALAVHEVSGGAHEVQPPALGVEAHDVVGEQAFVDGPPDRIRQDAPQVGLRPGDVHEVGERRVRALLADEPRRQVQVVVVEEHRRVGLRVQLCEHGVRERGVHRHVAFLPRVVRPRIDVRCIGQGPEVVLEEPEGRVRDDVVEPVVGRRIVRNQPEAVRRSVPGDLVDRLASRFARDGAILLGHRACDPRHVVMRDEAAESRHETAAASARDALSVLAAHERGRATVRDDDQLSAV